MNTAKLHDTRLTCTDLLTFYTLAINMWSLKFKIQYCLQLLKKLKYFDVNLARHMQDSYAQNHQTAMKEIKGNLNKWRDIPS